MSEPFSDYEVSDSQIDDNYCDNLFLEGKFEIVDTLLGKLKGKLSYIPLDIILSYLTITFAAKSRLTNRSEFFKEASKIYTPSLLQGLE